MAIKKYWQSECGTVSWGEDARGRVNRHCPHAKQLFQLKVIGRNVSANFVPDKNAEDTKLKFQLKTKSQSENSHTDSAYTLANVIDNGRNEFNRFI